MNETSTGYSQESWQEITYTFASIIVGFVGVFGNTMTIVAIQKREKLQTIPNKFILNLAVADILMVAQIIFKVSFPSGMKEAMLGVLSSAIWNVSTLTSIFSLVLVAGDRFIYIYRPLRYPMIVTPNRANVIIASTWLIIVTFCSSVVVWSFGTEATINRSPFWFRVSKFVLCVFLFALLFTFYALLIRIVLKQRRIIAIQLGATAEKKPADYKFLKMILPVALFTELCWAPYISLLGLDIFGGSQYMQAASHYIGISFYINAAVNFFVYAARNTDFRNTYKSLLHMKTESL